MIGKVQSGYMVDQLHSSVLSGDLSRMHTGMHHSQPLGAWCERGRERAHPCIPTLQSTQPWATPLTPQHPHIFTLFEWIGIDMMDEPQSPRVNHGVVVIDHATK